MGSEGDSSFAELEARLARVEAALLQQEDLRAIEQLRFRYWYAILDKDAAAVADCFADDAFVEYPYGAELHGREAVREYFAPLLEADDLVCQVPRGSNSQIELVSETEARGRWLVDVLILRKSQEWGTGTTVQYHETYRKTDQGWKISRMGNGFLGIQQIPLREDPF